MAQMLRACCGLRRCMHQAGALHPGDRCAPGAAGFKLLAGVAGTLGVYFAGPMAFNLVTGVHLVVTAA